MRAAKPMSQKGWYLSRLDCFQFRIVRSRPGHLMVWRSDVVPTHMERWQYPHRKHSYQR